MISNNPEWRITFIPYAHSTLHAYRFSLAFSTRVTYYQFIIRLDVLNWPIAEKPTSSHLHGLLRHTYWTSTTYIVYTNIIFHTRYSGTCANAM